jgi:hypothetical protein
MSRQNSRERLGSDDPTDDRRTEAEIVMDVERQRRQRRADREKAEKDDAKQWRKTCEYGLRGSKSRTGKAGSVAHNMRLESQARSTRAGWTMAR